MSWGLSPEHADWWYVQSWRGIIWFGLIAAVAAGLVAVFTAIQFWSDGIRDQKADERSRAMEVQLGEANARAKEAEFRLEELRRQGAPRQVFSERFLKLLNDAPSASVEILFLKEDPETFKLAQELFWHLRDAKWDVRSPLPIPHSDQPVPLTMAVGAQPSGVTVLAGTVSTAETEVFTKPGWEVPNPATDTPYVALFRALLDSVGTVGGGSNSQVPTGALRVVVGPRL